MNINQALRRLRSMTYKPGYSFQVEDADTTLVVRLTADLPDTRALGHAPAPVSYTCVVPSRVWEGDYLDDFMYNWLRRFECHELCEWLAFDGVRFLDPHAPGTDPDGRTL